MSIRDMYLRVEGGRAGLIRGEAVDADHLDEIELLSWNWGMNNSQTPGGTDRNRATFQNLRVMKRVDSASTGLMSALRSNDTIKATLSVRKAGHEQIEFFRINLERGRIVELNTHSVTHDGVPELIDELVISFPKVKVEYHGQGGDGLARGATTFDAEISTAS